MEKNPVKTFSWYFYIWKKRQKPITITIRNNEKVFKYIRGTFSQLILEKRNGLSFKEKTLFVLCTRCVGFKCFLLLHILHGGDEKEAILSRLQGTFKRSFKKHQSFKSRLFCISFVVLGIESRTLCDRQYFCHLGTFTDKYHLKTKQTPSNTNSRQPNIL